MKSSSTPTGKTNAGLSRHDRPHGANVKIIGAKGRPEPKTDWARVTAMSEAEITRRAKADPDAQPIPARAFKHFVLTPPHVKKKSITIRVDETFWAGTNLTAKIIKSA